MKTKILIAVAAFTALTVCVFADEKMSDAATKDKILGYWGNARHSYLIQSDGIMYMCPRDISTTTNRWAVKGGQFYLDSEPHEILILTHKKFAYRSLGENPFTVTWARLTEKEAEGK